MTTTAPVFDAKFVSRRIDPNPLQRPAAPAEVWNFHNYPSWKADLWNLVETFADQAVIDAFLADPPEFVVSDDMSWLEDKVRKVHGVSIDVFDLMMNALQQRYRTLRAAHGTRTADVGSFYNEGIHPLQPLLVQRQARDRFLSSAYPELTQAHLDRAIAAVSHDTRADRVWFECNETELIRRNGHYMLYGSEYLLAIVAHIEGLRDYRPDLKRVGEPVVFLCDVPMSYLHPRSFRSFAGRAVEILFEEVLGETGGPSPTRGGAFSIRQTLTPKHIVGHYRPSVGRDAFAGAGWP